MNDTEVPRLLDEMKALGSQLPSLPSVYPLEPATFGVPASEADIAALEEHVACSLPADYKAFLLRCSSVSAMDFYNGYAILERTVVQGIMSQQEEVPRYVRRSGSEVPVVPMAGDGGGNLFLLAAQPPFTVWKWDHETGAADDGILPEQSRALVPVAGSFTEFLRRVVEDWRHFMDEDTEWPYISG
jgi:hypothetical protein